MKIFKIYFLLFSLVLSGLISSDLASNASIQASPNQIIISLANIPANAKSLFVPLNISEPEKVDLYKVELKDIIVSSYVGSIQRDENQKILGISFASLRAKSLPEKLEAIVYIRPLTKKDEKFAKTNITINWDAPWTFSKPTRVIPKAFIGFNSLSLYSEKLENLDAEKEDRKRKSKRKEQESKDFYVKSLGQTLMRSERNINKEKEKVFNFPELKELGIFAYLPEGNIYERVYIPLALEDAQDLQIKSNDFSNGFVWRVINQNVLELSSSAPNAKLPNQSLITGKLTIKQSTEVLANRISTGLALSEPAEIIHGVSVSIVPNSISLDNSNFNPLNFFK
jgi:hypothetical protein